MTDAADSVPNQRVVSRQEWLAERTAFLAREKEFTKLRDELSRQRRDVTLVAISRAPLAKLEAFQQRMGWTFKWVSSGATDFNFDYQASFALDDPKTGVAYYNFTQTPVGNPDREGISIFFQDGTGAIFHTYSCYARGIDLMNGAYNFLDLVPKGRDEHGPWLQYHDRYTD